MADIESGPASSEMEVSALPPDDAKDEAQPPTPSTVATEFSEQENIEDNNAVGETDAAIATLEPGEGEDTKPNDESDDIAEDVGNDVDEKEDDEMPVAAPTEISAPVTVAEVDGATPRDDAEQTLLAISSSFDDDLPSDEEVEDAKNAIAHEQEWSEKESFVGKEEEAAENMAEDEVNVQEPAKELPSEESLAEAEASGEEVAEENDEEENTLKEEETNDPLQSESPVEASGENDNQENADGVPSESPVEAAGEEVSVENDEEEEALQAAIANEFVESESPPKSEGDNFEEVTKDTVGNDAEPAEEEAPMENDQEDNGLDEEKAIEPLQSESPPKPESVTDNSESNESDGKDLVALSGDEKNAEVTTSSSKPKAETLKVEVDVPKNEDETDDSNEEPTPLAKMTPRTIGISFAQAFGNEPLPPMVSPPVASLSDIPSDSSNALQEMEASASETPTSHSALSASKNKKASDLISQYQEKVAHEALPGDAVPIQSSSQKGYYFDNVSPATARILQKKADLTFVELNSLPDMNSVRAKFEKSARKSPGNFEFGESFRQKKRIEQLSEKEKEEDAKVTMRGFNEKVLTQGKRASGEIDNSSLPKSFTFDTSSNAAIIPNDGVCRVDYMNADFRARVFVVHKTRGMLLLQDKHVSSSKSSRKKSSRKKKTVPGGKITEEEFLAAAKESGSPQVQLQIAAREAAIRNVYEMTGLDIREQADRLKPAVLVMNPAMNAARGYQYLRNENQEGLFYFLQVDDNDLEKLQEAQGDDAASAKLTRPSEDPGDDALPTKLKRPTEDPGDDQLTLKVSNDYSGYEFVQDPVVASKYLKKDGDDAAVALAMIMSAAAQEAKATTPTQEDTVKEPDAKATEYADKSMLDDEIDDDDNDEVDDQPKNGTVRTIGITENAAEKPTEPVDGKPSKTSSDTADVMADVCCCCSFW